MMDLLNEKLISEGKEPVAFDTIVEKEFVGHVVCL
jgi:hypothetical protein